MFIIVPVGADEQTQEFDQTPGLSENDDDITVNCSSKEYRYWKLDPKKGEIDVYSYLYEIENKGVLLQFDIYDYYLMDGNLCVAQSK